MSSSRLAISVLIILLTSSWAGAVSGASSQVTQSSLEDQNDEGQPSSSSWRTFSSVHEAEYAIRDNSGLIHSAYGSFDPLLDPIPLGAENLWQPNPTRLTGIAIVQSISTDMTELNSILAESGFEILDVLPDSAYLIRLPILGIDDAFATLAKEQSVRWISEVPLSWRISPSLSNVVGIQDNQLGLDITPTPDLTESQLSELTQDLSLISDEFDIRGACDAFLCQIQNIDSAWLPILLMDGRILHIAPSAEYAIHNSNASALSGIDDAFAASNMLLNGSGEVIAISDTGIDGNHGDFNGRIRAIYNQFGPDNSHQDRNSGHGTHVAATLLGDGSGDASATGMVPASTFHFYQLEADSSGVLARWGSLYEMFSHSWQQNARIQTNSWGNENLVGKYSTDSRSADSFLVDYPRFIALFSAGELGENGYNSVTPPGTSKNVITIGASTTGSFSSEPAGSVYSGSSMGTTLDGRIKPDLVAPGVMICSARAEEAQFTNGGECSTSTHSDGTTPLYMTLNGSSMATAVGAGAATMVRQYLREVESISEPRSDLIKAILINGAEDLGQADIPNAMEGWGQIDVSNSLYPQSGGDDLSIFYDATRQLNPGHSFVYTFEVSGTADLDLSLVWVDREGTASGNQSTPRLVNDLDLTLTSPEGIDYLGNDFSSGYSTTGGSPDRLNNVERAKIQNPTSGVWTVTIGHAGGSPQDFALVLTADASETILPDLTIIPGSLSTSVESPLQGDTFLIETAWSNQAAGPSGAYTIEVEDLTTGSILLTQQRTSLPGGGLASISFPHSFSTTGLHTLELRLDTEGDVVELNDEINGVDNNRVTLDVYVSQIGVRLTPLMPDGSHPSNAVELDEAKIRTLNPSTGSHVIFDLELKNEGTSEITVDISASPVQLLGDGGLLHAPQDEWWKVFNESGPWTLAPFGEEGDRTIISLNLSDMDADLSNPAGAQYALPGTFVSQLTLWDKNAPTVSHSLRVSAVVERVEGLYTVVAGTDNLGAEPGEFAIFSLSIRNTGNGPTQYTVSCESDNRWIIYLGSSQTSTLTLEPLSRLQFLPLPVKVRVPNNVLGRPLAGALEDVTCITQSVADSSLFTEESATVEVFENRDFSTDIYADGLALGALALADDRSVLNDDTVSTELVVTNRGNVPLEFTISAASSQNNWPIQLVHGSTAVVNEDISVGISAGSSTSIVINTIVPLTATMGVSNTITIRTTLVDGGTITNATRLVVQELALLDIENPDVVNVGLGQSGVTTIGVHNVGNVPLSVSLTMGTLPAAWTGGFLSSKNFEMDMNREASISVVVDLPGALDVGLLDDKVTVIIEARTPGGEVENYNVEFEVNVLPSIWLALGVEQIELQEITSGSSTTIGVTITNLGNVPSDATLNIQGLEGWNFELDVATFDSITPGNSVSALISASPTDSSPLGLATFTISVNSTSENTEGFAVTGSSLELEVTRGRDDSCSGIGCILVSLGLPQWTLALFFFLALAGAVVFGLRMRNQSQDLISPDEELIPRGSALLAGSASERRAAALDTTGSGEVLTGGVSDEEIQAALSSSLPGGAPPAAPDGAPPLPLSGLPDGWTMDQWVAYGHLWWEQNQP